VDLRGAFGRGERKETRLPGPKPAPGARPGELRPPLGGAGGGATTRRHGAQHTEHTDLQHTEHTDLQHTEHTDLRAVPSGEGAAPPGAGGGQLLAAGNSWDRNTFLRDTELDRQHKPGSVSADGRRLMRPSIKTCSAAVCPDRPGVRPLLAGPAWSGAARIDETIHPDSVRGLSA
jgi:hypothetical protein